MATDSNHYNKAEVDGVRLLQKGTRVLAAAKALNLSSAVGTDYHRLMNSLQRLAEHCDATGKDGLAAKYRAEREQIRLIYVNHF